MNQEHSDLSIFCLIVLLFGASVGILHGMKKSKIKSNTEESVDLSTHAILDYVQPLMQAHSIDSLASALTQFPKTPVYEVMQLLLADPNAILSKEEIVELLFAVMSKANFTQEEQNSFFELLVQDHRLAVSLPIVLVLVRSNYAHVMANLLTWIKQTHQLPLFYQWVNYATNLVIDKNDYNGMHILYKHASHPQPEQASELLFKVVVNNKSPLFIPLLKRFGANINYAESGKTLLMYAVEQHNRALVQALLEAGADPKIMIDPAKGNALQIASEQGDATIENILRKFGARQD